MSTSSRIQSDTLRTVADLLDAHPDIPDAYITFYSSGRAGVAWNLHINNRVDEDKQKVAAREIMRDLGGKWDKDFDWGDDNRADFIQRRAEIELRVTVHRTAVCERVVTGVETVTLPAVEALPERTEEREIVEWRCEPVLSEALS